MSASPDEHHNALLCYEYAKFFFEGINQSLSETSRKLTATLLCAFTLCITTSVADAEVVAKASSLLSLLFCTAGLLPSSLKGVVSINELLNSDWYYKSDEDCRRYIAGAWQDAILEAKRLQSQRSFCLILSLAFMVLSLAVLMK